MKTVHGNAVFIREAKLDRTLTVIIFQHETSLLSNSSVNFPEHKANYTAGCKRLLTNFTSFKFVG